PRPALLRLVPDKTARLPDRHRSGRLDQRRDPAADPARRRGVMAGHQDVEGQHRSRLRHQDAPGARPVRPSARRRQGDLRRRVRAAEPATPPRPRLAAPPPAGTAARHLHPPAGRAAHDRRLDLATGKLYYRIRDRKRWQEFLDFLKTLRRRWPADRLYVILDNFSPHKHPQVRAWCAANQVELVFLPTYASWLNWIEPEFAAVRYFALAATDHRTHAEQDTAIGAYIRWRNQRAQPKTGYATNSKSRHPDYPFKAA